MEKTKEWGTRIMTEATKPKGMKAKNDAHLVNIIRRCREELQDNKPVQAHMWLGDLERYLYAEY